MDKEESALNERITRNNHAASVILCGLFTQAQEWGVRLDDSSQAWLTEHKSIDRERERLASRGSYYFRKEDQ